MIIDNTSTCAYDCFGEELLVGDSVSYVFVKAINEWKNKIRTVIVKGKVIGWTAKRIDIEIQKIANNTDIQEDPATLIAANVGDIVRVKPNRVSKITGQ